MSDSARHISAMKSTRVPMSIEAYETLKQPFGYKVEYWDGEAVYTPREVVVACRLAVAPRPPLALSYRLLPAEPHLAPAMVDAFLDAFADSVDFCDWEVDDIARFAGKRIDDFFAGWKGAPHPASQLALEPDNDTVAGLALVRMRRETGQIVLDLLLVRPKHQRQRLASGLLTAVLNRLHADGIAMLDSDYHICNDASRLWHQAMEFIDQYDDYYARLKYGWYRHEIWRRGQLGLTDGLKELEEGRDYWLSWLAKHDAR